MLGHGCYVGSRGAVPGRPVASAGAREILVVDVGCKSLRLHRGYVNGAQAHQQTSGFAQETGQDARSLRQCGLLYRSMAVNIGRQS